MERSLETAGQPIKNGSMAHEHSVYMLLAEAAVQAGDQAQLRKVAPRLEELAGRDAHRPYLAIAHRAWGVAHRLAGEYAEAESRLNDALLIFEAMPAPWQIGRTLEELGALAMARSDRAQAKAQFSRALKAFETLSARPDADRTRRALEALS